MKRKWLKILILLILGISSIMWCVTFRIWTSNTTVSGIQGQAKMELKRENLMRERVDKIINKCRDFSNMDYWKNIQPQANIYTYAGVTYCQTQKVGCTYWLRILRFLAKDFKPKDKEIIKPSDIDRHQIHFRRYRYINRSMFNTEAGNSLMSNTKNFMFTRHPLTRLWSAYIDKLLLPDFWRKQAVQIAEVVRNSHEVCVPDITFEEFLKYVVITPAEHADWHWKPAHLLCSPCHAQFDVIGKLETFAEDTEYIIEKFGLSVIKETIDKETRVKEEIKMLVEDYLRKATILQLKCNIRPIRILKRLWFAFQVNGYIHSNTSFPILPLNGENSLQYTQRVFLDAIYETIDSQSSKMKMDLKHQKRDIMVRAYKSVPSNLRDEIIKVYKFDFELFSYDVDI